VGQTLSLSDKPAFKDLGVHFATDQVSLQQRYQTDPQRRRNLQADAAGLRLHFDQNDISEKTLALFDQLYNECGLAAHRAAMFQGGHVNNTENRPALHTALRSAVVTDCGPDSELIRAEFQRCCKKVDQLLEDNADITDVVNIGIGGSDLGPRLACSALADFDLGKLNIHFCSSLDRNELADTLIGLNPATTLFIVSSKSFGTEETLYNARLARQWLADQGQDPGQHMLAVTANSEKARAEGFIADNTFALWDGVGGRYSLWSAIGLPIMLQIGSHAFTEFLTGAHAMDQHFYQAESHQNLPMLMAALEVWHHNFYGYQSMAVVPYSYRLRLLPSYLQQLTMESNGKQVDRDGHATGMATNPIVWGAAGTEGQHSFHQLLHQGTVVTPVDFILPMNNGDDESSLRMAAHCLAQRQALLEGKTLVEAATELLASGTPAHSAEQLAPHKVIPGNRPCNLITFERVCPHSLGALIALYEHKTFASGVIWGVNSFDQWGVELGKQISANIQRDLTAQCEQGNSLAEAIGSHLI
jgi:glucose-6-phosphate isomerase